VLPPPVTIPLAFSALLRHGLNGPMLQASQQLQIISAQEWYSSGSFDVQESLHRLEALPVFARKCGYARVRAAGGPGKFVSEPSRQAFLRYERHVTPLLKALPLVGLCCYASSECVATDMFDIMSAHPQTLIRTQAGWGSL